MGAHTPVKLYELARGMPSELRIAVWSTAAITKTVSPRPAGSNRVFADLLIARTRMILWIALLAGLTFGALEIALAPRLAAPFAVKCVGVSLTTAGLVLLRGPWATRHALPLSLVVITVAYLLTAISRIVSSSREYATTASHHRVHPLAGDRA